MNPTSAKETSPLMLASAHDQAFTMQVAMQLRDDKFDQAVLADSLRLLTVDISMEKGEAGSRSHPLKFKADQPGLGGE